MPPPNAWPGPKFPLPKGLRMDAATGLELQERTPETGAAAGQS